MKLSPNPAEGTRLQWWSNRLAVAVCSIVAVFAMTVPQEAEAAKGAKVNEAIEAIKKAIDSVRNKEAESSSADTSLTDAAVDAAKQVGQEVARANARGRASDNAEQHASLTCVGNSEITKTPGTASPTTAPVLWTLCSMDPFGPSGEILLQPQSQWVLRTPKGDPESVRK